MRYRAVAERIAGEILKTKRPGERLPGIRELARTERISMLTARNVYKHLADKGLVISRQGSGTFVAHGLSESITDMAAIRPPDELLLWAASHLRVTLEGLEAYDPPRGHAPLLEQSAAWLRKLGVDGQPIITSGSQQALFLVGLALLKQGDAVAVEDPGYRGAARIFESLGATVIPVPYLSSLEDLERIRPLRIRLFYTMPQGHIPTGRSMPDPVRNALLDMAAEQDFLIVEDDPLSEVLGMVPLKSADRHERVVYIKSFSNILGPGLRLGLAVVPEALSGSILHLKEINDLSISGILQRCLCSMLSSSELKAHVLRLRMELRARQAHLAKATPWKTEGVCLWLRVPGPSRIHQENLLSLGLKVTPGDIYGPQWSEYLRLSILTPGRTAFEHAVQAVRDYLAGHTGHRLTEF
ncbi:MAG TPA: PLP-dependent aminotransferase family protein [Deltaproteobacteria bacterium]|nr:PLP-dependent aminotransferase family protein [Deltaproteobacteria bacterium]HQI80440.1 PLP-dependent aminotransferase family protein [Deltaproteobacteria bacterium]